MASVSTTQSRRMAIAALLRDTIISQQEQLVTLLRGQGFALTQSSVSRDLRELGVAKLGDRYVIPPPGSQSPRDMFATLAAFVQTVQAAGPHLTVIKTTVGSAQSVALAIDRADWPEEIGTVAGDDTIFVATVSADAQRTLIEHLQSVFGALYFQDIQEG